MRILAYTLVCAAVGSVIAAVVYWRWVGAHTGQIQALASIAVLWVTVAILWVYHAQERIMATQAKLMERQTALADEQAGTARKQSELAAAQIEVQKAQASLEGLLATAELAPLVVPQQRLLGIYPWPRSIPRALLSNMGRSPAFDLRATSWRSNGDGTFTEQKGVCPESSFVGPGEDAVIVREDDVREAAPLPSVLVLHYKDFRGMVWHTTWNLSQETGQYAESDSPVIWNEQWWGRAPQAHRYCAHCPQGHA